MRMETALLFLLAIRVVQLPCSPNTIVPLSPVSSIPSHVPVSRLSKELLNISSLAGAIILILFYQNQ